MAQKNVLIVYAHQSPSSFNAAAKDVAVETLAAQGYKVTVSDLYAMKFNPSATSDDILGNLKNPANFVYNAEACAAWKEGTLSDDIKAEHSKVSQADLIIFQFPMYWFNVPGILKGWFDRVFTQGFAFTLQNMYDNGMFKDKKAMLSFTTGGTESMYLPDGINGDINVLLWPLQSGILHFCGFQVLAPQIFWSVPFAPPEARKAMLDAWQSRLKNLMGERPLTFASNGLFDLSFQAGFRLKPEIKEARASQPYGLAVGHHLGKPLPPDSQTKSQQD